MKRFFKYSLIIVTVFSVTSLYAQKKWTLEECITYALQNNIQIKREILQTQKFKKDKLGAYMSFAPSLGAQFSHSIRNGKTFSTTSGGFVNNESQDGFGGIGGSLDLFQGLSKWNSLAQSKFDLLASLEGVEELKRNISLNIAAKYLEVLYANENYNLAKNRVAISEKQVESSQQQSEVGRISNADFLQVKSQAIGEKVQLTAARNSLEMSTLELVQMLDLPSVDGFGVVTENIVIQNDTIKLHVNQYFEEAVKSMPSIRKAEYNQKSANKQYLVEIGNALPSLSLGYQIRTGYSNQILDRNGINLYPDYTYREQSKDNLVKYLSFDLTIPIFGRLQNYIKISKAKIDKLDANYAVEAAENNLLKSIQQAYSDAKGSYASYQSMIESEASFSEVFRTSEEKFNLGMINAVDYGIARNNFIKAQGDLLHAKYSYLFKLKILEFYRGIPITL